MKWYYSDTIGLQEVSDDFGLAKDTPEEAYIGWLKKKIYDNHKKIENAQKLLNNLKGSDVKYQKELDEYKQKFPEYFV